MPLAARTNVSATTVKRVPDRVATSTWVTVAPDGSVTISVTFAQSMTVTLEAERSSSPYSVANERRSGGTIWSTRVTIGPAANGIGGDGSRSIHVSVVQP